MKYDVSDVKSVTNFLIDMKGTFDTVNAKLPEDAPKLDFDEFQTKFEKANNGILKNRDDIKAEKLKAVNEYDSATTTLKELQAKLSSIDESLPDKYNQAIEELSSLKATIKDGAVDIDLINANKQSEIKKIEESFAKTLSEKLAEKDKQINSLSDDSEVYKTLFFSTVKKDGLEAELERIKVNPEDRPLIKQAHLGRAQIVEDGGDYKVLYNDNDGKLQSGVEFWDKWAANDANQKYLLASDNSGGGATPPKKSVNTSEMGRLEQALAEATNPAQRLFLAEKIAKMRIAKK